jgi:phosphatidate cytidylyltransferase
MKRLLTAAVGVPLALLATFYLPADYFFLLVLVVMGMGSLEYVRLLKPLAPNAPLWLVPVWVVPASVGAFWVLSERPVPAVEAWLLVVGLFFTVGLGTLLLAGGIPSVEAPVAVGIIGFGIPYFALPIACTAALQRLDPWLAALLYLIVWLGDSAAYYVGSAFGRHKMAPRVSPN